MRHTYYLIAILTMLASCASQNNSSVQNPDSYCRDKGLEKGKEAYNQCVSTYISEQCTERGFKAGTPEFIECEKGLRNAALTRQQMFQRGY